MTFPIGTRVQWAEKMRGPGVSSWVGVVTGHPRERMVEVDGAGAISVGLLEEAGKMDNVKELAALRAEIEGLRTIVAQQAALRAEIEALQAVIVQQAEALGEMAPAEQLDDLRGETEKLREAAEKWDCVGAMVSEILSEVMGSYNPASLQGCPLPSVKRFAEFVRGE